MISLGEAAINLGVALALGAAIGFERQWRHRLAGLRTNTLVALGAASFVMLPLLVPGDTSPTRVAAQVASGIGFIGAGIIFKEGLSVRGLNTAATLWCSAAVGVLSGAGQPFFAALAAALVIFVNLLLRPIIELINRQSEASAEIVSQYLVRVVCLGPDEAHIRTLLLQGVGTGQISLRRLDSTDLEGTGKVEVTASLSAKTRNDGIVERIVGRLSLEPAVSAASWSVEAIIQ
jgi:putative Mg2+ transporter-C (MgtC) family protein